MLSVWTGLSLAEVDAMTDMERNLSWGYIGAMHKAKKWPRG